MRWMAWMSSRMVRIAVAALLTLSLGTPSVFAFGRADEMRQPQTRGGVAEDQLRSDLGGDTPGTSPSGSVPAVFELLAATPERVWTRQDVTFAQRRGLETVRIDLAELRALGLVTQSGLGDNAQYELSPDLQAADVSTLDSITVELERAYQLVDVLAATREKYREAARTAIARLLATSLGGLAKLRAIAAQMAPPTGGILAADESTGTAGRRLALVGLENTDENRQAMRRMLLTTPGLNEAGINAVILDRDTLTNTTPDGSTTLVEHLKSQGIVPGLKTDEGLEDDPAYPGQAGIKRHRDLELENLPALLAQAQELGLGFTKFRTTVPGSGAPEANMRANARVQARQAQLAQAAGLVPMIEPEVTFDGSDGSDATHDLATAYATTTQMLEMTFEEAVAAGVALDGAILKTSMILAGKNAAEQTDAETVGVETLRGLLKTVPAAVPAVVFLSGGQSDDQATTNLAAVTRVSETRFAEVRDAAVAELRAEGKTARANEVAALPQAPWELSYSFGRGLQAPALAAWGGKAENFADAQLAMEATARKVQSARMSRATAEALAEAEATFVSSRPDEPIPHAGKVSTTSIAAVISDPTTGYRGKGKESKSAADKEALRVSNAIAADQGLRTKVMAFEGELDVALGDLEAGADAFNQTGAVVNPRGLGEEVPTVADVIEGTTATAEDNKGVSRHNLSPSESGGTSIQATGQGVGALGVIPDMYAAMIVTTVSPEKRAEVMARLDPMVEQRHDPFEAMKATLGSIAEANGLTIDDLEVVLMKRARENARVAMLEQLQQEHPGLVITQVSDGTVAPAMLATFGRKEGKHLVAWTTTKTAEMSFNRLVARAHRDDGAVFAARIVSADVGKTADGQEATDLSRWNIFNEEEQRKIRNGRPADAEAILSGERILTNDDFEGSFEASMSLITDNGWFNLPKTTEVADGVFRVVTIRTSDPNGDGNGRTWIDVDDVVKADVDRMVARGTFAMQEPAAADAEVVDQDDDLLALMEDIDSTSTFLVHAEAYAQTPGFFIAFERALKRFQEKSGFATIDEAALQSSLMVQLYIDETELSNEAAAERVQEIVEAINQSGATELKAEWFQAVSGTPSELPAAIIGPKAWQEQLADSIQESTVKVSFEQSEEDDKARSGAAALYAAGVAVAGDGTVPQDVATRLDIQQLDDLLVPQLAEIAAEAEPAVHAYQETVAGVGISG